MMKNTSSLAFFLLLLFATTLDAAEKVRVSVTNPNMSFLPAGVALKKGFFKDEGLDVEIIRMNTPNTVTALVTGDLGYTLLFGSIFGPGGERGVYKTTDGGATWKRVLFVDDETGASDLAMSYTDPKTIYASTYQRRRSACCVNGGGPGSGIWKSIDGGDTWTRLTNGLPAGPMGRIGLDTYRKNGSIVYASIEAQGPPGGRGGRGA